MNKSAFLSLLKYAIIIYLIASFICGSLNFLEWTKWQRLFTVIGFLIIVSDIDFKNYKI